MTGIERRLAALEGRAAVVGGGGFVVGIEGADGMVRVGERLLSAAEFDGLWPVDSILITRRKDKATNDE